MSNPTSLTSPKRTPFPQTSPVSIKAITQRSFKFHSLPFIITVIPRVCKTFKEWTEEDSFWTPHARKKLPLTHRTVIAMPLAERGPLRSILIEAYRISSYQRKNFALTNFSEDPFFHEIAHMRMKPFDTSVPQLQKWVMDFFETRLPVLTKSHSASFNELAPYSSLWHISAGATLSPEHLRNQANLTARTRNLKYDLLELGRKYSAFRDLLSALREKSDPSLLLLQNPASLTASNLKTLRELLELPAVFACLQVYQKAIRLKIFEIQDAAEEGIENWFDVADELF
jgi:hypothetical protein